MVCLANEISLVKTNFSSMSCYQLEIASGLELRLVSTSILLSGTLSGGVPTVFLPLLVALDLQPTSGAHLRDVQLFMG